MKKKKAKRKPKKSLDQLSKERLISNLKIGLKVAAILFGFLGFLAFIYDPYQPGDEVFGIVKSVYKPEARYAVSTRFIVKLDSGDVADVKADRMGTFKKGKRVVLQELTSTFFRRKAYRFLRVQETHPPKGNQLDIKNYEIEPYNKRD